MMRKIKVNYDNGYVMEEGFSDNYGKQGKWYFYNDDGTIYKEVDYKDDLEHGTFIRYFENGKVAFRSNFLLGNREGPGIEYYENGKVKEEWVYKNGEFFPINCWEENGNQTLRNGTGFIIEEFAFSVDKIYLENGKHVKTENISRSTFLGFFPSDDELK